MILLALRAFPPRICLKGRPKRAFTPAADLSSHRFPARIWQALKKNSKEKRSFLVFSLIGAAGEDNQKQRLSRPLLQGWLGRLEPGGGGRESSAAPSFRLAKGECPPNHSPPRSTADKGRATGAVRDPQAQLKEEEQQRELPVHGFAAAAAAAAARAEAGSGASG